MPIVGRYGGNWFCLIMVGLLCCARPVLAQEASKAAAPREGDRFSVRDFGAVGDGQADDAPAFEAALNALIKKGRGALAIPAGTYRFARRVSVEAPGIGIALAGEGQGVSVLLGDNPDGVLRIHDDTCKSQVTVRELSFLSMREGAGTALEVSSPHRGVRNYRTLLVENVEIRGQGLPTRCYFNYGIKAVAQWRPLFLNVIFSGVLDPALNKEPNADADDSPAYRPTCGLLADWSYAPSFQHCYVWSANTGYSIVSRDLAPEGPEDSAFYRSNAVGCRIGIDVDTPICEPQLVIESCHINCRDVGVRIKNRKFFQITTCLFYGNTKDLDRPYTDIQLSNSYGGVISGNVFHAPSRDNLKPDPPANRVNIQYDEKCKDLLIVNNMFNAKGKALSPAPDEKAKIEFRDNQQMNPHAEMPPE
jgi:hypothetical protein